MNAPQSTAAQSAARPQGKANRYRQFHDVNAPVQPDWLLGLGDVIARTGLNAEKISRATLPDARLRGSIPHLKAIRDGRSVRIRGATFLAWLDELESAG